MVIDCLLLLVHSPLVGPSTLRPLARVAEKQGFGVCLPDLTGIAATEPPFWSSLVDLAVLAGAESEKPVVVIGHSGAGPFLPLIGERLGRRLTTLVFMDAGIPPSTGVYRTSERMFKLLDEKTTDGMLARWLDWWPREVVEEMIPGADDRQSLLAEMPNLPRSFYDEALPLPEGWTDYRCAYLALGDAYQAELETARGLGWPTTVIESDHLGMYSDPDPVMAAIRELIRSGAG